MSFHFKSDLLVTKKSKAQYRSISLIQHFHQDIFEMHFAFRIVPL
jgi:hypothetical protein